MFEHLIDAIATLSPAQWCQAFYLLASAIIVTLALMPTGIAGRILSYGPRSSARAHPDPVATAVGAKVKNQTTSTIEYLTSVITSYGQVPHAWFKHFYVMSLLCSCFWLAQYLAGEGLLFTISRAQSRRSIASSSPSMTLGQIGLVWALMVLQATRRLVEHSVYLKPSSSRMWFVAWLLGLAFYMVTSVAVWVEGSRKRLSQPSKTLASSTDDISRKHRTLGWKT